MTAAAGRPRNDGPFEHLDRLDERLARIQHGLANPPRSTGSVPWWLLVATAAGSGVAGSVVTLAVTHL